MAFVFKPVVTSSVDARAVRRRGRFYWAGYTDEDGRTRRTPLKAPNGCGITDRAVGDASSARMRVADRCDRLGAGLAVWSVNSALSRRPANPGPQILL
jgi:hypothetical protein